MILYEGNHLMLAHLLLLMHCTQCEVWLSPCPL